MSDTSNQVASATAYLSFPEEMLLLLLILQRALCLAPLML